MSNRNVVMMVGEKPSIALSIAQILSNGTHKTRRGIAGPVHEFSGHFQNRSCFYKVTSVIGHVYKADFLPEFQNWSIDPSVLFSAPILKLEREKKKKVCKHLQQEAHGVDTLVLWLDCDREGENICFEVIQNTQRWMNRGSRIYRAKFSGSRNVFRINGDITIFKALKNTAITAPDITRAMKNLVSPNKNESDSVDARQEIDLKVTFFQ
eukprot:TRINITY_DN2596_c1_g1_i2.p1 TRINITY_DN2596_c1_g1~~TRINITY_DN2596_c1_g1_i2.p1  ORF type:complete len:209 (+),score=25.46 TRINITY_DN2596_c1_g1_i2:41-667(+)